MPLNLPEEHMNFKISNIPGNSVYINPQHVAFIENFYEQICSVPKNRPNYVDSQSHKKSL